MSNAMRTGKRSLAGVAAVALGAGMLTMVAATPASATTASIASAQPGYTFVKAPNAAATPAKTNFAVSFTLTNTLGVPADAVAATETLSVAITSTPSGPGTPAADDTTSSFKLNTSGTGTNAGYTIANANLAGNNGTYTVYIDPSVSDDTGGVEGWADDTRAGGGIGVPAGSYNIRVSLFNSISGATLTQNIPVIVYPSTVIPAATLSWVDESVATSLNPVTSASGTVGRPAQNAFLRMVDANNYPLTMVTGAGRLTANMASTTDVDALAAIASGYLPTTRNPSANAPGVFTVTPNGNWAGASNAYRAAYATTPETNASLPVTIASRNLAAGAQSALTSTPSIRPATGPNFQVPEGTTSFTFTTVIAAGDDTAGTVAWNIESAAAGGAFTPNAGVAAITQVNGQSVITVTTTANAIAANTTGADGRITFTGGYNSANPAAVTVDPVTVTPLITTSPNVIGKFGEPVTLTGTLTDQFNRPISGAAVVSVTRTFPALAGTVASTNPAADGTWSMVLPAAVGPTTAANYTFQIQATANGEVASNNNFNVTVQYSATGGVTSLTAGTNPVSATGQVPSVETPRNGLVVRNNVSTTIVNPASAVLTNVPAGTNGVAYLTFTSVPATSVTVTAPEGAYMSTTINATPVAYSSGSKTLTVPSGTPIAVWTTKPGVNTFTAKAGDLTATADIYAFVRFQAARNVALTPAKATMGPSEFIRLTLKVTDMFGNPVPNSEVSTTGNATADVQLVNAGGGTITQFVQGFTNAQGELVFAYTSPNASGAAAIQATGVPIAGFNQFGTVIDGAPAPVTAAVVDITVTPRVDKSIVIVGERATVSGKSGILVEGVTTGIENGKTVTPFIRFPGQTTFTEGSARPQIQGGEFTWQRKTGKRVTVYVVGDGITSNRVTIQAS